jgi:hypothetical protein
LDLIVAQFISLGSLGTPPSRSSSVPAYLGPFLEGHPFVVLLHARLGPPAAARADTGRSPVARIARGLLKVIAIRNFEEYFEDQSLTFGAGSHASHTASSTECHSKTSSKS